MMEVTGFNRDAFEKLIDSPVTAHLKNSVTPELIDALERNPHSRTVFADGKPILVGGVILHHANRGEAWAFLDQNCKDHFLALHKIVKKYLGGARLRRIEAVVHNDYPPGHRWVKALGFQKEADNLRCFSSQGKDAAMYSIISEVENGR